MDRRLGEEGSISRASFSTPPTGAWPAIAPSGNAKDAHRSQHTAPRRERCRSTRHAPRRVVRDVPGAGVPLASSFHGSARYGIRAVRQAAVRLLTWAPRIAFAPARHDRNTKR